MTSTLLWKKAHYLLGMDLISLIRRSSFSYIILLQLQGRMQDLSEGGSRFISEQKIQI